MHLMAEEEQEEEKLSRQSQQPHYQQLLHCPPHHHQLPLQQLLHLYQNVELDDKQDGGDQVEDNNGEEEDDQQLLVQLEDRRQYSQNLNRKAGGGGGGGLCAKTVFSPTQQSTGAAVEPLKQSLRDDWNDAATFALLDAWGRKFLSLKKGSLKLEDWAQVAGTVTAVSKTHKTDVQCKNRLDTLKKKFKLEKQKQFAIGSSGSKWPFYKQLDWLLNNAPKQAELPGAIDAGRMVRCSANEKCFTKEGKSRHSSDSSKCKHSLEMSYSSPSSMTGDANGEHPSRKRKSLEAPIKTLANAIIKFAGIYEKMEKTKQQQLLDLERIRMEFTRDLELHRMQLFMQTRLELARMKYGCIDFDASVST